MVPQMGTNDKKQRLVYLGSGKWSYK